MKVTLIAPAPMRQKGLVFSLVGSRARRDEIAFRDISTACLVVCESLIGRFPRNKGFRNFSKFTLRKPVCRGEL
jgi:hypothetical protein